LRDFLVKLYSVLEIGVYLGFSLLVWLDAVGPDGFVTGLELSREYAQRAEEKLQERKAKNAEVLVGDALER
jgi:predicted O-methyltransferase YrrM